MIELQGTLECRNGPPSNLHKVLQSVISAAGYMYENCYTFEISLINISVTSQRMCVMSVCHVTFINHDLSFAIFKELSRVSRKITYHFITL